MDAVYLSVGVHRLLPAEHADWIDGLLLETLRIKGACCQGELVRTTLLSEKAHVRRPLPVERWDRYGAGGSGGSKAIRMV